MTTDHPKLIGDIKSRGYRTVTIRPTTFEPSLVPNIADLAALVRSASVSLRGWDFPHIPNEAPTRHKTHIDSETDWQHEREFWRAYQSGQFVFIGGLAEDWRDRSSFWAARPNWKPGQALGLMDCLYWHTEVFEFAGRWAKGLPQASSFRIEIATANLQDRVLQMEDVRRAWHAQQYRCKVPDFSNEVTLTRDELNTLGREHACTFANNLFQRFGWDPSKEILSDLQSSLFKG